MRHAIGSCHHAGGAAEKFYIIVRLTDEIAQELVRTHGHEIRHGIEEWNLPRCGKACRGCHHIALSHPEINVLLGMLAAYLFINLIAVICGNSDNIAILSQ